MLAGLFEGGYQPGHGCCGAINTVEVNCLLEQPSDDFALNGTDRICFVLLCCATFCSVQLMPEDWNPVVEGLDRKTMA